MDQRTAQLRHHFLAARRRWLPDDRRRPRPFLCRDETVRDAGRAATTRSATYPLGVRGGICETGLVRKKGSVPGGVTETGRKGRVMSRLLSEDLWSRFSGKMTRIASQGLVGYDLAVKSRAS